MQIPTCPPDKQANYSRLVDSGYKQMSQSTCVIAGLGRNIESQLPLAIRHLETLGSYFADYSVVVYENDSTDSTPTILQQWAESNNRVIAVTEVLSDPVNKSIRCLKRTERMAKYRTAVQDEIRKSFSDKQYVVLYDFDLGDSFSLDGVATTFGLPFNWHMVGSNSLCFRSGWRYYDVWALRKVGSDAPLWSRDVTPLRWWVGDSVLPVNSVFGGLGVYKMPAFLAGVYDSTDCEHVPFHRTVRQSGYKAIFLNPNQVTLYS